MTAPAALHLLHDAARIAVVNRSDAAVRCIQAVRDHNLERGTTLTTVALHTDEESDAWFVQLADEAVGLGPARVRNERTGAYEHSYLDLDRLADAMRRARVDAAWVGWGFVSERAEFAELCARMGVTFIGPSAEVIRRLGDKVEAKLLAESVGVPVAAWSRRPVHGVDDARAVAATIGFPLLAKAAAGGGGRGIRVVDEPDALPAALQAVVAEAGSAFGDSTVFLEKLVTRARHLEVQIAADRLGQVWALGVRDCTVQRRRQKMIEESGAPGLGAVEGALRAHARAIVGAAGYVGVGTVEFLYDLDSRALNFMEVNPRLQVEHGVTELTTGVDLVKMQLDLAAGRPLAGPEPTGSGAAVEARITAEDPADGFRPAPGQLVLSRIPTGPGVRVDTGLREGDRVVPDFDPLVLKVLAYGRDRAEAIARLTRALQDSLIVVEGGATTTGFLLRLLADPALRDAAVHTGWVDDLVRGRPLSPPDTDLAVVLAAVDLAERQRERDVSHLMSSAARGRPELLAPGGRSVHVGLDGRDHQLLVHRLAEGRFRVETPDGPVDVLHPHPGSLSVTCAGLRRQASVLAAGPVTQADIAGNTYRLTEAGEAGVVRAPAPSVVVQVRVVPGQQVAAGDVLVVLESMKLEVPVRAAAAGVVREVRAGVGSRVDVAEELLRLDGSDHEDTTPATPAISFRRLVTVPPTTRTPADVLDAVHGCLLGFDSGYASTDELGRTLESLYSTAAPEGAEFVAREREVLDLYARCAELVAPLREEDDGPTRGLSSQELLYAFLRAPGRSQQSLPADFIDRLADTLSLFGAAGLDADTGLDEACYRLCSAQRALRPLEPGIIRMLQSWASRIDAGRIDVTADDLSRIGARTDEVTPAVAEAVRAAAYRLYARDSLAPGPDRPMESSDLEALLRASYQPEELSGVTVSRSGEVDGLVATRTTSDGRPETVLAFRTFPAVPPAHPGPVAVDVFSDGPVEDVRSLLPPPSEQFVRWTVTVPGPGGRSPSTALTFLPEGSQWREPRWQGIHPSVAERLELWRLDGFHLQLLESTSEAYLFKATAEENDEDVRLVLLAEVTDLSAVLDANGQIESLPDLERLLLRCLAMIREQVTSGAHGALAGYNRIVLYVRPLWKGDDTALRRITRRLTPAARNLGIDRVLVRVQTPDRDTGAVVDRLIHISRPATTGMSLGVTEPSAGRVRPLTRRQARLLKLRGRGLHDPYEIVYLLTSPSAKISDFPPGRFQEYDLDGDTLVPVERAPGNNEAGIVVGLIENRTREHPDGMRRVVLLGDPSRGLGALAEPECRRVLAGLALARELDVPVEWFTVSSGARISMTSGTENMDWVARVLRSIVHFTQDGGEINIVVTGVNVGAQPYFNAEATMLMHTKGILVMTASSSMLLTGKEALDFAGGVSAADNLGIGGYDRVMGPNGQAQYWAADLEQACEILFRHYEHAYREPGEDGVRPHHTDDPVDRDISSDPHPSLPDTEFDTVGEIFSATANPDRKKPFEVRAVMSAVVDRDCTPLERWEGMAGAESAVVWDAHIGGHAACLIGIQARSLPRRGIVPADGPETWSGATLFPRSSKKIARALNAASANRPAVVLANLAGFDGSPESLRELQLEYGAEIGRAVTNFVGPIFFCVLSRYHGGAFVVFSKSLNQRLEVIAVEGAKASVIGGSAAAAVVFAREVANRVAADPRTKALTAHRGDVDADVAGAQAREAELQRIRADIRATVAREFDDIHTIDRALQVGSVDRIVPAARLRAAIVESIGGHR